MKKAMIGLVAAAALGLGMGSASAADPVTLQLKWVTQAQFAGYYVAKDKGFYTDENLDVTIKPGGPDIAPEQVIAGGGADVIVDWMGPKSTGITKEADFKGKTLGVWFFGNEYPFYAWMNKIGMPTEGGADGVTVIKQSFDVQPLIQKQADCISVMTYNELGQALDAGFKLDDLTVFNYTEMGNDMLEDGLYVLEDKLKDKAFFDKMTRFVKASMKGWDYAREHPEEAAQIVINNDDTGAQTLAHQQYMIKEVDKLTEGSNGVLDPAAFDRTAKMVLDQKIITKQPEGAWTHDVTDAAGFKQ